MLQINRNVAEARHAMVIKDEPQGLGATRSNLSRLLRSLDFVGWSTHEESGRLDRRALTRFASGSTSIFSRREIKEAEKSAVSVLIDCSGSMDNHSIVIAQEVAIHLSRILNRARVSFAVTGFHMDIRSEKELGGTFVVTSTPRFIPFKQWGESYGRAIPKLGAIDQCAFGGTPDYSGIYNAIEDISRREEGRKILFVLTDADGYNLEHMKHLQKFADSCNVTIIAIGVGRTDVKKCFVNSTDVYNLDDLASTSFNALLKAVERKAR